VTPANLSGAALKWTQMSAGFPEPSYTERVSVNFADFGPMLKGPRVSNLPLYGVVAASSAFAAGEVVTGNEGDVAADIGNELGPQLAVWLAPKAVDSPFRTVQRVTENVDDTFAEPDEALLDTITKDGTFALADGVYTDNSGISHAIQAGATEVVAFCGWDTLELLFTPSNTTYKTSVHGVSYSEGGLPFKSFPIFTMTEKDAKAAIEKTFQPLASGTYFSLRVGELQLTTRESPIFGIPEGRSIRLQVVLGGTSDKLGVGAFVDLADFSVALQHIMGGVVRGISTSPASRLLESFFP